MVHASIIKSAPVICRRDMIVREVLQLQDDSILRFWETLRRAFRGEAVKGFAASTCDL
jgi:hypothetical protein